jgi:hemerythrin-like domain-containing protein
MGVVSGSRTMALPSDGGGLMPKLLDKLNLDHKHLSRLLDLMEKQLDGFHEGNEPDFELMCEMLEYVENYADQVHHPTEDLIFHRMLERSDERRDVMETLFEQHQTLSRLSKQFRQSLEGVVHEAVLRRDLVEQQGRELLKLQRQHLDLEEGSIFPLARELLTDDDWERIQEEAPTSIDPVFGEQDQARFRTLYQHLMGSWDE